MSANAYREVYEKIVASSPEQRKAHSPILRTMKIQEEAGEVAQAVIGFVGANARKGYTHDEEQVAKELADVVVTAMVALHDWVPSPKLFMEEHLEGLLKRIKEEGS
jgi:NTP pyrophosphatase (non-canonical NTP hydrolase)